MTNTNIDRLQDFATKKTASDINMEYTHTLNREEINNLIPQSPPFLFLNQATWMQNSATPNPNGCIQVNKFNATYFFSASEPFFAGHFPQDPVVPGVLLCESCLQAGALLLALQKNASIKNKVVVTRMDKVKFKEMVRPDEELSISVTEIENLGQFILMSGNITKIDAQTLKVKTVLTLEFMVGIHHA